MLKAVITCAGLGTRLLPFTKELPKEMAPIFWKDNKIIQVKPLIELIFEHLYSQGIRDFCFITGQNKRSIENHFTPIKSKAYESMKAFHDKLSNSKIFWITQHEPKGFGDAVRYASTFVGEDYFVLQAGDVAMVSSKIRINELIKTAKKEKIEQANEGIFMNFEELGKNGKEYAYKFDRDKKRNVILGIKLINKALIYVKNSGDFFEIAERKKAELLGIVYYYQPWKKWVWEQCDGVILAPNCGKELFNWIEELKKEQHAQ